jgi:hypothetical protein
VTGQAIGPEKGTAYLHLWHLVQTVGGSRHLVGYVYGHPTLEGGHLIVTSDLVRLRIFARQHIQAETLNTIYHLGDVGTAELLHDCRCREVLDDLLGPGWRPVKLGDQ